MKRRKRYKNCILGQRKNMISSESVMMIASLDVQNVIDYSHMKMIVWKYYNTHINLRNKKNINRYVIYIYNNYVMSNKNNKRFTSCDEPSGKAMEMLARNDDVLHQHSVVENYKTKVSNTIDCSDRHRY